MKSVLDPFLIAEGADAFGRCTRGGTFEIASTVYAAHGISFWYDPLSDAKARSRRLVKRQFVLHRNVPIGVQGFFDLVHTDAMGGPIQSLCLHSIRMEEALDYNEDGIIVFSGTLIRLEYTCF
jgi:hypothetical protein